MSSTATIPRDVVVVLETSASMRGDKLFEAKHAALTVMETLGVKDRVCIFIALFITLDRWVIFRALNAHL